jgi:hypothetical protein
MKSIYRTWADLNKYGFQIYYFRVILGRKIQIHWEKNFRTTPWASTGLVIPIFLTIRPVLSQRGAQNIFSRTDLNSTTQNYSKTIYLKSLLIYTCRSPIFQIQSPVLAQRVAWNFFSQHIRIILHPKITLEWYIGRLCYLISDEVQIHDYLGPLLTSYWSPGSNLEAPYFF